MYTEQQQLEHRRYEASWLKPFTDTIPSWPSLAFLQRSLAREGKQFALWSLDHRLEPTIIEKLTVTGLQVSRCGPTMFMTSDFGSNLAIGTAPQQVGDHLVFLWIPAIFDARFTPYRYEGGDPLRREMTWRFCCKMASNPGIKERRRTGQVYFTELSDFRKLWPNTAI